jgi:hypothetical protein
VVAVARIEWASYAPHLDHASPFVINWTTMRNNTYGLYVDHGTPWMSNSTIENSTYDGIHTAGLDSTQRGWPHPPVPPAATTWPVPIFIENSTVRDNGRYGGYFDGSVLNISFSEFTGNDWSGIYWTDPNGTVRYSDVSYNGLNWYSYHLEDMAGVAIVPSNNPVYVASPNPDISHNTFEGNTIGVYAGTASPGIDRNDFINNSEGIWAENVVTFINNNTIEGLGNGIWALSSDVDVFDNTIKDTVDQYASSGIIVLKASTALIVNNSILDMGYAGISSCKSNVHAYRNAVTGFDHIGISIDYASTPPGACPGGGGPWTLDLQNNTISSTKTGVWIGVYINYGIDSYTIKNNSINNITATSAIGLVVMNIAGDIRNNSIKDNYIGASLYSGLTLIYNNIEGNNPYGVQRQGGSEPVDARWNYWGDPDGPTDTSDYGVCGAQTEGDGVYDVGDPYSEVDWCGIGSDYLGIPAETGPY